ncbi:PREDICTED: uncharacterized protein LOC103343231 isoform X2 [Prunus mume]|uniref:Uncharacterized protein LOC103343231 isoform X2 n=1 Tax=Prunus mume TaxID=102107 RepID=A0ABM1LYJ8_PRUMU|nr:PREDICTED: uncharacterized protein LOC103343231 isoform X2 [Prunus mume]
MTIPISASRRGPRSPTELPTNILSSFFFLVFSEMSLKMRMWNKLRSQRVLQSYLQLRMKLRLLKIRMWKLKSNKLRIQRVLVLSHCPMCVIMMLLAIPWNSSMKLRLKCRRLWFKNISKEGLLSSIFRKRFSYVREGLVLGQLLGNRFTVTLSSVVKGQLVCFLPRRCHVTKRWFIEYAMD